MHPRLGLIAGLASTLIFTGCAGLPDVSIPSVPTSIFSGDSSDCPALPTGPAPYQPPFPESCRSMNKTASGVKYIPILNGDVMAETPGSDATIVVNYEVFLADTGERIDSSYARGESSVFPIADLIDGWAEAVRLMNPGDEWLVFVPSEQAFGGEALGDLIPPNSDLVYRVQLEGFLSQLELDQAAETKPSADLGLPSGPDMAAWQVNLPWNPDRPGVTTLPSGVSLVVLERGPMAGTPPTEEDLVRIHYEGRLAETSAFFDSSWSAGGPADFRVGSLIPGFTEALTYMHPGDRFLVHIPSALAYGERGAGESIPPNADLMFQIIMLEVFPTEED